MSKEIIKNVFGYMGGSMLVLTLIPQLYKTYKTKKIRDISLLFIIFQIITCVIVLIYSILLMAYPLIIANSIVMFELFLLLYAKIMFGENKITPNLPLEFNEDLPPPPEYIATM